MLDKLLKIPSRYFLYVAVIGTVILLAMSISISGTMAKYARQKDGEKIIVAKEFYFESDLLKEPEENAVVVLNSTATEVKFELRNHADKLRFAKDEIKYNVTVEVVEGEESPSLSSSSGTIAGEGANSAEITLSGLEKGKKYKVTATGSAGYTETLEAVFEVSESDENIYKYLDTYDENYVLLTIWTENVCGNVEINFPEGLVPDYTDLALVDVQNYKEEKYVSEKANDNINFTGIYSSHTYRFFIDKKTTYSADYLDIEKYNVVLTDAENKIYIAAEAVPQ